MTITPQMRAWLEAKAEARHAIFEEALRVYVEECDGLDEDDLLTIIKTGYMLGLWEGIERQGLDKAPIGVVY